MANTAFKGTISIQHDDGTVESEVFGNTDVSLVYSVFYSNGSATWFPVKKNGYIVDISLAIVAADTTKYLKLWINEIDTQIKILQSTCFHTLQTRGLNKTPIRVLAGQPIAIQAIT